MTHSLYLTGLGPELASKLVAARTLYNICRAMDDVRTFAGEPVKSHAEAAHVLDVLADHGIAHVASGSEDDFAALEEFKARLRAAGFAAQIDPDVERLMNQHEARKLTAEGSTPEQVFKQLAPGPVPASQDATSDPAGTVGGRQITVEGYRTALALLPSQDGDPLAAAALACNLLRTTGHNEVYQATVDALILVFPWIKSALIENGLLTPDPPHA